MADMTGKEPIELTIRAAQLGKAIMSLVGVDDTMIAKLILKDAILQVQDLARFIDGAGK